jgi:3-phosphoshikimate 1-carboxyvinyltransferase
MEFTVRGGSRLHGRARVPGDKSLSHRGLILGAIAQGVSRVNGFLPAADCLATLRCLRRLGVRIEETATSPAGEDGPPRLDLQVWGEGPEGLAEPEDVLDCGGSGTTMRLLSGVLAGRPTVGVLTGNARLRQRPMGRVVEPLRLMGAQVMGRDGGRLPPLTIQGGRLRGIDYTLPVASAQVKSAVLLAALSAAGPTVVREPGPARDHTERMLQAQGAELRKEGHTITLTPTDAPLRPLAFTVPGDISSAAFLVVAACLAPSSEICVEGVGLNPTRTGLLDVMQEMGADITTLNRQQTAGEETGDLLVRAGPLRGVEVGGEQVVRMIDEFPILAVAATQAQGITTVRDAAELRVKESDRISATVGELRKMGARIEERPDGFVVEGPTPLQGAVVDGQGDHRLAMALTVAGLIAGGETRLLGAEYIDDSFPRFASTLRGLGAEIR